MSRRHWWHRAVSWLALRAPVIGPLVRAEITRRYVAEISPSLFLYVTCPCGEQHQFSAQRAVADPSVYEVSLAAFNRAHKGHRG
jgi:hypothetical protein